MANEQNNEKRTGIFEAQNWRCCYCGARNRIVNDRRERIEHVKRIAEGGLDDAENAVGACGWRNSNRLDYEAEEWFIHAQFMARIRTASLFLKRLANLFVSKKGRQSARKR